MKFKIIPNEQTPKALTIKTLPTEIIIANYKLLNKFLSFARRQHNCVGLAANQVSLDGIRIMHPFFAIKNKSFWDMVINPKIINYVGKKENKIESCLTWIGKNIEAERYPFIDVQYCNLKGDLICDTLSDFEAQIWQHEYNHLMGIKENIKEK